MGKTQIRVKAVPAEKEPKKKRIGALHIVLLLLCICAIGVSVYLYSELREARSYTAYVKDELKRMEELKDNYFAKYTEASEQLEFWSARACVALPGSEVYHEDTRCPNTDPANLRIMSIDEAIDRGYRPCLKCGSPWKVTLHYQMMQ